MGEDTGEGVSFNFLTILLSLKGGKKSDISQLSAGDSLKVPCIVLS